MKALSEFTKATLIGGLVVILPLGVLLLALEKIVEIIRPLAHSIAQWLPRWFHFPDIVTLLLLLLLCFVAGLLAETLRGRERVISSSASFLIEFPAIRSCAVSRAA